MPEQNGILPCPVTSLLNTTHRNILIERRHKNVGKRSEKRWRGRQKNEKKRESVDWRRRPRRQAPTKPREKVCRTTNDRLRNGMLRSVVVPCTREPIVGPAFGPENMDRVFFRRGKNTQMTSEVLERDMPFQQGWVHYGPNTFENCCYCRYWQTTPGFEDPVMATPVIALASGRNFGRAFIPSGSLYLHTSVPKRHQQLIASREEPPEPRPAATRGAAPVRSPAPARAKPPSKRGVDFQRPMSAVSQTASSPLSQGPICRINDRHDVLTPDSYFDAEPQHSPGDVLPTLADAHPPPPSALQSHHHQLEEAPQLMACRERISELELELELLRTETERQRKEREKYQRLYESTALCQICMVRRRNSFILPCSHFVYCGECLERHWEMTKLRQCPMCRGPAHSVIITNLVC